MPGLPLVEPADLWLHLQLKSGTDQPWFQRVIGQVVTALNRDCDRVDAPFSDPIATRTEVRDAPEGTRLQLDYPIDTVTTIKLGLNFASPDFTLDPNDPTQVYYEKGKNEIRRTDGVTWNSSRDDLLSWARGGDQVPKQSQVPSLVQVVYATRDYRPADAQLAVVLATAMLYNQRGQEGAKSESLGNYSYSLASLSEEDSPIGKAWRDAVEVHRRMTFL